MPDKINKHRSKENASGLNFDLADDQQNNSKLKWYIIDNESVGFMIYDFMMIIIYNVSSCMYLYIAAFRLFPDFQGTEEVVFVGLGVHD